MEPAYKEVSYQEPHLKFFDELIEEQLKRLGTSPDFHESSKVQDSIGGFYPTYDELADEGIADQKNLLY